MENFNVRELVAEAYHEVMKDMNQGYNPSRTDLELSHITSELAKYKGELATILDKAARANVVTRENGRIVIKNREAYIKMLGELPNHIKDLQHKLLVASNESY